MTRSAFLDARDFLLRHRTDYDTAYRDYQPPVLGRFNWALDYFDGYARGNLAPALWIVEEDGSERRYSYAEMAERSDRTANFLRGHGVVRGDHVLLMLPNRVELWDVMLACMKLGAVIVPTTTLVAGEDLVDRIGRGQVRHVVAQAAELERFAQLDGFTRFAVGGAPEGWVALEDALHCKAEFLPRGETHATDPLLIYFTSGTTNKPKLVLHSHQSYPGRPPVDDVLDRPAAGRRALEHQLAWLGQACVELLLRAVQRGRHGVRLQLRALLGEGRAGRHRALQGDLAVRAADRLAADDPGGPGRLEDGAARTGRRRRAAQSRSHRAGRARVGHPHPRRLRPVRDLRADRQSAGPADQAGLDGAAAAGLPGGAAGAGRRAGGRGRNLAGARAATGRPDARLRGRQREDGRGDARRLLHTGDTATRDADGYYFYVGRNDDVFKSSDYRISPFELESALIEHDAVLEAAVVPSPDPLRLYVPKAYITLVAGVTPGPEVAEDIFRFVRANMAPYKRIRRIEFVDLPKTISGKIRRVELRKREAAGERGTEYLDETATR
jgi:acetyl-CoA synthetase